MTPELKASSNILIHVPDLVRYGSKCYREISRDTSFSAKLTKYLRSIEEAVSYPPSQVFIGNLSPESLTDIPSPWYGNLLENASPMGKFGGILSQDLFYEFLHKADRFGVLMLDLDWISSSDLQSSGFSNLFHECALDKEDRRKSQEILRQIESGKALPLIDGGTIVGCIRRDHDDDESLSSRVLLENLVAKASGALALSHLLIQEKMEPKQVEYIISCSEEAVGDRYNRGGGNLAKAIGEMVGCSNAVGVDVKAFCAAPVYALIHASALVRAGIVRNVVVVGGGSMPKLGMKAHRHIEMGLPILEDVLGGIAFLVSAGDESGPRINLDIVGRHKIGCPSSPQGLVEALVCDPLKRCGRNICDINKYAVELHNPEVTLPAGAGDVPLTNYKTLAAVAVMKGEISRGEISSFIESRGMPGFAPTQGHIPAGVPFLGHALDRMRSGTLSSTMIVAKGSLFLGRMTQQSDGASVVLEV